MVCGAPVSWSSGGRSAVQTMRGTPAWSASATAGWSSAAAVPLVTQMTVGLPEAIASPSAKKAALRSSSRTWTRSRCARGSASGVEREPGQTTASVTPSRAHSSTRVALKVACTLTRSATPCRRARLGPPLVVLHGFTQTGRLWGPFGDLLAESHTLVAVDLPGHGDSGSVRADLAATADLVAEAARTVVGDGPSALLGYSLGARVALHVAIGTDLTLSRAVLIGATAGIEDPADASDDGDPTTSWRTSSRPLVTSRASSTPGCVAPCSNGSPCPTRRGGPNVCATARRVSPRACGCAERARRSRCGTLSPGSPVPSSRMAGSDDTRFAAPCAQNHPPGAAGRHHAGSRWGPRGAPGPTRPDRADRGYWLDAVEAGTAGPPS